MEEQVEIKVSILGLLKVLNIIWLKSVIWQYMLGYVDLCWYIVDLMMVFVLFIDKFTIPLGYS